MTFHKIISLILAIVLLLTTLTVGFTINAESVKQFSDVTDDMWAYDDIVYVTEYGLMNGTGGTTFSPTVSLTRAMVVTVLYRMEGSPRTSFMDYFVDVPDRQYYSEAVVWAKYNGIVTSTSVDDWGDEYFSPNRDITRQELATMFIRFAQYKNIIVDNSATLDKFTDKSSVADWASDAVKWATSVGLINGTGNGDTLSPTGKATREQFAAIIHRFNEAKFDYKLKYNQPRPISTYTEKPYPYVDDADIYVAVDGNDKNPGTIDKPLATFDAARLKVRELKKTAKDEIVVAFKAGDYGSLENVTFTADDAGSESIPIKYCKYGDGDVVFCNGVYIEEEAFTLVDGEEAEMFKKNVQNKIYKADLAGKISKFEFTTRLFTETGIATEAREPNSSFYTNMTTTVDPWSSIQLQLALPGIVERLASVEGMKINGYLRTGWMNDTFDILSYDPETKVMVLDLENSKNDYWIKYPNYELMYEGRTDDLVFFSNRPEFLDANGEYWFDNKTSALYVYGAKGDYSIDNGKEFVTLEKGAEYISFVGFEFNTTSESAIVLHADNFTFDLGKIGNVGGKAGIHAPYYVKGLTVSNSEMFNCVDSCIYVFSAADGHEASVDGYGFWDVTPNVFNLEHGNNVIVNNYFHDFTLPNYFSSAIEITADVGTYIAHNYFYEGAHGAIRYNKSVDVTIEYNVFDRIMTKTYDYGAVYTGNQTTRGNATRYNIFMNIPVYAIYLDCQAAGQEVYGNIFYNTQHTIVQNSGRDNVIRDNVSIYSMGGATSNWGRYGHIVDGTADTYDFENDALNKNNKDKPQPGHPMYETWKERWPSLYNLHADPSKVGEPECVFTTLTYFSGNAAFGDPFHNSEMIEMFGIGENNVNYKDTENPLFVNPSIGDYRIRDDADFFKIPYEKIGRY